jgi:hypothetical protein
VPPIAKNGLTSEPYEFWTLNSWTVCVALSLMMSFQSFRCSMPWVTSFRRTVEIFNGESRATGQRTRERRRSVLRTDRQRLLEVIDFFGRVSAETSKGNVFHVIHEKLLID